FGASRCVSECELAARGSCSPTGATLVAVAPPGEGAGPGPVGAGRQHLRRGWDSNPRNGFTRSGAFKAPALVHYATSPPGRSAAGTPTILVPVARRLCGNL